MSAEEPKSILISGESGMGKTFSLKDMREQERTAYLNCEGGKPLPFKNKFKRITIDDPYEIYDIIDKVNEDPDKRFNKIIIDTVSFMMERFEAVHVIGSSNTMAAWGDYGQFFRNLMLDHIAKSEAYVICLGHLDAILDEDTMEKSYKVPVKGALAKNGLEAYFTTVISAKKVKVKTLLPYEDNNALLNITDRDRDLGYKHVFQTRTTKQTVGDRIRTPDGLFNDNETYIDNNAQIVIDRLTKYYAE